MLRKLTAFLLILAGTGRVFSQANYDEIGLPPHNYWSRPLNDPFTKLTNGLESGQVALDRRSEKDFVVSVLKALDIPVSSQMLVFSTTSLQLSRISPRNPRALYFREDLYLGYVPGGRIEVVSLDSVLGGIFYIFDIPKGDQALRVERSDRCMNCHAGEETHWVPGLLIKSVVPGRGGGSLTAFRVDRIGHDVELDHRFGGWYVTGARAFSNHWGNVIGQFTSQKLTKIPVEPGVSFDSSRYPAATSDILPQLIHEHQAGFVNRVADAAYRARAYLEMDQGKLTAQHADELEKLAARLTRYILFADEAALPPGGIEGDSNFKADFLRRRRTASGGASLKDFDLRTRLFKNRCSYMIYSSYFQGLAPELKRRIYERLRVALRAESGATEYAYLPKAEKQTIRTILKETLQDLPKDW